MLSLSRDKTPSPPAASATPFVPPSALHRFGNQTAKTPAKGSAYPENGSVLFADQVELLYAQAALVFGISSACALILIIVLWSVVAPSYLIAWSMAFVIITLLRYLLVLRFQRLDHGCRVIRHGYVIYLIGACLAGLLWGSTSYLLLIAKSSHYQFFLAILLAGLCAGTLMTHAARWEVSLAFSTPILLPLAGCFFLRQEALHPALGWLVILFWLGLLYAARTVHENFARMLSAQQATEHQRQQLANEINQRESAEAALRDNEKRFRGMFECGVIGMALLSAKGEFIRVNRAFCDLFGYKQTELTGRHFTMVVHPEDLAEVKQRLLQLLQGKLTGYQNERRYRHKSGRSIWGLVGLAALRHAENNICGFVVQLQDITQRHQTEQALEYQANHDALTHLSNRYHFEKQLKTALNSARTQGLEHSVCYLDLDQFKIVNDLCGHVAGDQLLIELGSLLYSSIREQDTLARLGGDEFGLLLTNCSQEESLELAEQLRQRIEQFRFAWNEQVFRIGVSIGLVAIRQHSPDLTTLISIADSACYLAKEQGGNTIYAYCHRDRSFAQRLGEMRWVTRIEQALEQNRLELYCQPIVAIHETDQSGGYHEILLRMRDDDGRLILPGLFLPAAERYRIASKLDRWVVDRVLERLQAQDSGTALSICAINLSGCSLSDKTFCADLIERFSAIDASIRNKLCFEITETAAISNMAETKRFISMLKQLGCRFALDDFGTGLSSFAYLKELPIDFIKIDGLFVKRMRQNDVDLAMVRSVNEIAHTMGLKTIAGYVENRETFVMLQEIGIDYAQGYHIGNVVPLATQPV